jgi:hypothetical protein
MQIWTNFLRNKASKASQKACLILKFGSYGRKSTIYHLQLIYLRQILTQATAHIFIELE